MHIHFPHTKTATIKSLLDKGQWNEDKNYLFLDNIV